MKLHQTSKSLFQTCFKYDTNTIIYNIGNQIDNLLMYFKHCSVYIKKTEKISLIYQKVRLGFEASLKETHKIRWCYKDYLHYLLPTVESPDYNGVAFLFWDFK